MKKRIYLLYLCVTTTVIANAQSIAPSIINSTGGTASVNGYIHEWSFGEVTLANTFFTPNLIVTQGVLQSDSATILGIHTPASPKQIIKVYPNPSQDVIYLQSEDKSAGTFQYTLMDISGKIILCRESDFILAEKNQALDISGLPAGMYLLKVILFQKQENIIQTYKVQKLN